MSSCGGDWHHGAQSGPVGMLYRDDRGEQTTSALGPLPRGGGLVSVTTRNALSDRRRRRPSVVPGAAENRSTARRASRSTLTRRPRRPCQRRANLDPRLLGGFLTSTGQVSPPDASGASGPAAPEAHLRQATVTVLSRAGVRTACSPRRRWTPKARPHRPSRYKASATASIGHRPSASVRPDPGDTVGGRCLRTAYGQARGPPSPRGDRASDLLSYE